MLKLTLIGKLALYTNTVSELISLDTMSGVQWPNEPHLPSLAWPTMPGSTGWSAAPLIRDDARGCDQLHTWAWEVGMYIYIAHVCT